VRLTEIDTVCIVILFVCFVSKIMQAGKVKQTSLCQQNVENTIPTYVHGTVMPDMSDLINRRSDSGTIGILLRFQASFEYGSNGRVSIVGMALVTLISYVRINSETITDLP
jgi:hypothetical protein